MSKHSKNYILNLIFPAFIFGGVTGILTGAVITLYKLCAEHVIHFSAHTYEKLREHMLYIPIVLVAFAAIAALLHLIYKKCPELKGGGIPSSIGISRGLLAFKWTRTLIGTFVLSLITFLTGIPLGNEGPSVQIGTAAGGITQYSSDKKHKAWGRYLMTGGACAGFSAATGAPISGILFSIEEAHQRISPMIILVSSISVMFCRLTMELLCPVFGVGLSLFPGIEPMAMNLQDIWLPILIGIAMGFFAVLFLNCFRFINNLMGKKLAHVNGIYKLFLVLALTLVFGILSHSFISTGHGLILEMFEGSITLYLFIAILFVRTLLTILANTNGFTGGIFLPMLAIGTTFSAIVAKLLVMGGLDEKYFSTILIFGIITCIAGMMKMPLTAIVFAVEALACHNNILYVIAAVAIAFVITEIFDAKSINDIVLENRIAAQNKGKEPKVIDTFVTVEEDSFAVGKQIRDIFWPANLFVLSCTHKETSEAEIDQHGGNALHAGDTLHVRYATYNEQATREELIAIVGEQNYDEKVTDVI